MVITSRERILTALSRGQPDRVPISCYELNPYNEVTWEWQQPSFQPLMELVREKTDNLYMLGLAQRDDYLESHTEAEIWQEGPSEFTRSHIITPKGDLTTLSRRDEGVNTAWTLEHLLKTAGDVEKYLSIPFEPIPCDIAPLRQAEQRLGDRGIMMMEGGDAAGTVAGLFHFGEFTRFAFEEQELFNRLVACKQEQLMWHYRDQLSKGTGPLYRIWGPEYFTPPYLPPSLFRKYVFEYMKDIVSLMHEHNVMVRMHCHGHVAKVLPMAVEMGVDAVDPLEPPPDGDINLADVKALYGDKLCLFGNMELRELEYAPEQRIRELVREMMAAAKAGGGFILMPTTCPIKAPLDAITLRNYHIFIETALEEGKY